VGVDHIAAFVDALASQDRHIDFLGFWLVGLLISLALAQDISISKLVKNSDYLLFSSLPDFIDNFTVLVDLLASQFLWVTLNQLANFQAVKHDVSLRVEGSIREVLEGSS
jgi:hypothetical protein